MDLGDLRRLDVLKERGFIGIGVDPIARGSNNQLSLPPAVIP
jgi:hypothetical protein